MLCGNIFDLLVNIIYILSKHVNKKTIDSRLGLLHSVRCIPVGLYSLENPG